MPLLGRRRLPPFVADEHLLGQNGSNSESSSHPLVGSGFNRRNVRTHTHTPTLDYESWRIQSNDDDDGGSLARVWWSWCVRVIWDPLGPFCVTQLLESRALWLLTRELLPAWNARWEGNDFC